MPHPQFPNLTVLAHPLIQHKLAILRDKSTTTRDFKQLVNEIAMLMAYEVTKDLPLEATEVDTPLEHTRGVRVAGKKLALVPILRAGLGMVEGIAQVIPSARDAPAGGLLLQDSRRARRARLLRARSDARHGGLGRRRRERAQARGRAAHPASLPGGGAGGHAPHARAPPRRADLRRGARPRAGPARLHPAGAGGRGRPAVRDAVGQLTFNVTFVVYDVIRHI